MNENIAEASSASAWSELVWDSGRGATAVSGAMTLAEGPDAEWSPNLLLATAAGASLLSTFLDLAQRVHLPLLGLVTQQRAGLGTQRDVQSITITVCITVPTPATAADAGTVWKRALREAPVLKALACRVVAEPSIVVLSDAACAAEGATA